MKTKTLLLIFICILSTSLLSNDSDNHIISQTTWSQKPRSSEDFNKKIIDISSYLHKNNIIIGRIALSDIAFPRDKMEYDELDGFGIMQITAFTKLRGELPPNRIYFKYQDDSISLRKITATLHEEENKKIKINLGKYRWDALYAVPIYLIRESAILQMDFLINRKGFTISTFTKSDETGSNEYTPIEPYGDFPEIKPMLNIIKREFPGFLNRKNKR